MANIDKANNVIRIPTSIEGRFFRIWVEFLTPIHNLTDREKDILAGLLKHRFLLSEAIKDEELLNKIVMSDEVKTAVREECGVSNSFLQVIMGRLRKTGILVDGKLNPKFIPKELSRNDSSFRFLLYFDLNEKYN